MSVSGRHAKPKRPARLKKHVRLKRGCAQTRKSNECWRRRGRGSSCCNRRRHRHKPSQQHKAAGRPRRQQQAAATHHVSGASRRSRHWNVSRERTQSHGHAYLARKHASRAVGTQRRSQVAKRTCALEVQRSRYRGGDHGVR